MRRKDIDREVLCTIPKVETFLVDQHLATHQHLLASVNSCPHIVLRSGEESIAFTVMPSGGSHCKYPDLVRNTTRGMLQLGVTPSVIANTLKVSPSFVTQQRQKLDVEASIEAGLAEPPDVKHSRPNTIHAEVENATRCFVNEFH
jgi:hypothetical protein